MRRSLWSRRFLTGKTSQTTCLKRKCESVREVTLLWISVALQHSMSAKVEYKTCMNVWQNNHGVKLKRFYKMSFAAWMLPTGWQELFYSEERCRGKNTVCFSLLLCLTSTAEATSVWWSTLLRWMNLISVTPSFHCRTSPDVLAAPLSPWVAWQELPAGHLGDVSSQCKRFVTLTKLLQHDSVTPSVCWTYSNKSRRKNKWRGWRERRKWRSAASVFSYI